MPSNFERIKPSLMAQMFRYFTAFLALYAVAVRAASVSNRSRNQTFALSADAQIIEMSDDTATVEALYQQFRVSNPDFTADEFTKWFKENHILDYRPDYSQIRFPVRYVGGGMGVSQYLVGLFAVSLDDESSFDELMRSEQIDWSLPQFAAARNMLFASQRVDRIQQVYQSGLRNRGTNVFASSDDLELKPIHWLLSQVNSLKKPIDYPVNIQVLRQLNELGVINLQDELKNDESTRKFISAADDIEIVRAFLPEPSDPQYLTVTYDIFKQALLGKKWTVSENLLSLLEPVVNKQSLDNLKKPIAMEFERVWSEYIATSEQINATDQAANQKNFEDWFDSHHIASLLKLANRIGVIPPNYQNLPQQNIQIHTCLYGQMSHFKLLLELNLFNCKDISHRLAVFVGAESTEKVKLVYEWGIEQGYGNLFILGGHVYSLLSSLNEENFSSFHQHKQKIIDLDRAGIIDVKQEMGGISAEALFNLSLGEIRSLFEEKRNSSSIRLLRPPSEDLVKLIDEDDFEKLKRYFPPVFHPEYQDFVSRIAKNAIKKNKWQIARGISEISEFKPSEEDKKVLSKLAHEELQKAKKDLNNNLSAAGIKMAITNSEKIEERNAIFKGWWSANHIETLLSYSFDQDLIRRGDGNFMSGMARLADLQHFNVLLNKFDLPWASLEYAPIRDLIFLRYKEPRIVERIYQYGLDKFGFNIFSLPGKEGLSSLLNMLQIFMNDAKNGMIQPAYVSAIYKDLFSLQEEYGVADFKTLFGKSGRELFSQELAAIVKEIEDKIDSIKKERSTAFLLWSLARSEPITAMFTLASAIVVGNFLIKKFLQRPRHIIEAAPQPRRHRERPRPPSPPQLNVVSEDPAVIRAREEREVWLNESRRADAAKAAALAKKAEAEAKAEAIQPSGAILAGLYENLAKAYQASYMAYNSYTDAMGQVLDSTNDEARNAAIIQAQAVKPDDTALNNACHSALADVRRQERLDEERLREAELAARRLAQHQAVSSKEQSLTEIMTKFAELRDQDNKPLLKLNQLQALVEQAHTLGFELNKLKPQLAPFVNEIERLQKQADEQIIALKIKEVFAFVKDADLPVIKRIEKIKAFRLQAETIGQYERPLDNEYRRSTELLKDLTGERQQYGKSLRQLCDQIAKLATKKEGLALRERLDLAKKYYERTQELMFQLGLSQEQVEAITEVSVSAVIKDLQKEYFNELGWESFVKDHPEHGDLFYTVKDLCHRIALELNKSEMKEQAPVGEDPKAYLERHQFMAISFNLARLFDQLGRIWPDLANVRHHLTHRYYEAQASPDHLIHRYYEGQEASPNPLFKLAQECVDEKRILEELHVKLRARDNRLETRFKDTDYFKTYCSRAIHYAKDTRSIEVIIDELKTCLAVLKDFTHNIDAEKGANLSADAKGLLADHARMRVNILCHHFLGEKAAEIKGFLEGQGMDEDGIGDLFKLVEGSAVRILRNKTMHGASVEAAGMVAVKSDLDGRALQDISIRLKPLRDLLSKERSSLVFRGLRHDAMEWRPTSDIS